MGSVIAPNVVASLRSARALPAFSAVRNTLRLCSRTVPAIVVRRREFILPVGSLRHASGLTKVMEKVTTELPSNDDQPEFFSLKGIISDQLLQALTQDMKLTHMSPVQAVVLPLLPQLIRPYDDKESNDVPPRDLLVKAKTGTGKTLAFLLPAIEARLKAIERHSLQAAKDVGRSGDQTFIRSAGTTYARERVGTLIISPTRELANQISAEASRVTKHLRGFGIRTLVGGESKREQMRGWINGRRDIVVGTPGRLRDLLMSESEVKRGMEKAQMLVLDEADTLLDMGFRDDIDAIKEFLPRVPERQTFLFSATVSRAIRQVAESSLSSNHGFINCVSSDASPVHAHVPQFHTVLPNAQEQIPHLLRLIAHDQLANPGASKIIVFLPTTKMTQLFATLLRELAEICLPAGRRTRVFELHSKRRMESRTSTSDSFRADKSGASVLITSDVSARGVDYPNVSRVVQLGIPSSTEQYIHRVGRTGRANTGGRGDIVLLPWEMGFLQTSLSDLPLRPLLSKELKSQVEELASDFDKDPQKFFADAPIPMPSRDGHTRPKHFLFTKSVGSVTTSIEQTTRDFLGNLDDVAIRETFMSNLGFYVGLSSELRLSRMEIVDGLKLWATEGLGLEETPYVSPEFLQKIGVGREKFQRESRQSMPRKTFGLKSGARKAPWEGRGQSRSRNSIEDDGRRVYQRREKGSSFGYGRRN